MNSILIDEDLHYLLRCIAVKKNKKLNATINEAVIDLADKNNIEVKPQLRLLYKKDK